MTGDMASLFEQMRQRQALAEATYAALKQTGQLAAHRTIAYRCDQRRCLLLDVVATPDQRIVHQPSYKHSPKWFAEKWNDEGRAKNSNGKGRSVPHTYDARSAENFNLQCDHISVVLDAADLEKDIRHGTREVTVSSAGDRYH